MTDRASWQTDAVCLLVLAGAVAACFPQVVLDGGVFFVQDMMVQNIPFAHYLHDALAEGRLPLWEPRINAGFPLFAEGQVGALYPPNWLGAALLSPAQAVTWSVLVHLWLAGAGMFLYLRRGLSSGWHGALLAGIVYGLSGFLVVRGMSPNFVAATAGVPWLFLALEVGLRTGRPARVGLCGGIVALQMLAGHPQAAAYGALAAVLYGGLRTWQLQCWPIAWRGALIAVPGVAICVVQLWPTMELAALTARAGAIEYSQFVAMSLPPERLLTLVLPDWFGNSAHGSYWGRADGFFIQLCGYVGVLTLPLAVVGARQSHTSARAGLALLTVLGLMLSLGQFSGLFETLYAVPGLRQFRIPTRFLMWWAFGAAALAGLGLDRMLRDQRPLRSGSVVLVAQLLVVLTAVVMLPGEAPSLSAEAGTIWQRWTADVSADLWRAVPLLLIGILLMSPSVMRAGRWIGPLILLVTFADLRSFAVDFNGTIPASVYEMTPATARAIQLAEAEPSSVPAWGQFRVASLVSEHNTDYDWHGGWTHDTSSYRAYPGTLRLYTAGLFGLANTMPGWSPLHLRAHWEFASGYPAWLGRANTRYVVTPQPLPAALARVVHQDSLVVSRLLDSLPRAWVAPTSSVVADADERLRLMRSPGFNPRQTVVLEQQPERSWQGGRFAEATVLSYDADRVRIGLPGQAGTLVLADTAAPGWRVYVDGEQRQLLQANHVFRGVAVAATDQQVEFVYEPRSVYVGSWISAIGGVFWVLLLIMMRRPATPQADQRAARMALPMAFQLALIVLLYGAAVETDLWRGALQRMNPVAALTR